MPTTEKKVKLVLIDEISGSLRSIHKQVDNLSKSFKDLGFMADLMISYVSVEGIQHFKQMANEITEITNRLELLNNTVVDTKLTFQGLAQLASGSRTDLDTFSEFFNRIGLSAGHYFTQNPQKLIRYTDTLLKQIQLMHLSPQQMQSVQASLLDAMELGYFDWRHMKSLLAHDNPLAKGYFKYMGISGDDVMSASRNHLLTAETFIDYLLSESDKINQNFNNMTLTLSQMGSIIKNQLYIGFSDVADIVVTIGNVIFKAFSYVNDIAPFITKIISSLGVNFGLLLTGISAIRGLSGMWSFLQVGVGFIGMASKLPLILIGMTALTTLLPMLFKMFKKPDFGLSNVDHQTNNHLGNIETNTGIIANKMDILAKNINDLVADRENLIIHNQIMNNMNLGGTYDTKTLADELAEQLKESYKRQGVFS